MALPVLIIGKSGSGKSASLRNFTKNEVGIINVLGKPLPFKNNLNKIKTDDYKQVKSALTKSKVNTLIIDDGGYLITNEFMRRSNEKGFQKFTDLGNNFFSLIRFIETEVSDDKIVYIMMHEDANELEVKPKTIGKLLDEKVCIEGMFTIVLRAMLKDGEHIFKTQSNGYDVAKSPMGMFNGEEIENDLAKVTEIIRNYYAESVEEEKINE